MGRLVSALFLLTTLLLVWLGQQAPARATVTPAEINPFAPEHGMSRPVSLAELGQVNIYYYPVEGESQAALRASMDRNKRHGWDAYTQWRVYWTWPGRGQARCDMSRASLSTSLTLSFPQWRPPVQAEPGLVRRWDGYVAGLSRHEREHLENARAGFERIRQIIGRGNCETAEAEIQAVLAGMRAFDIAYDSETQHGRIQGAVFP